MVTSGQQRKCDNQRNCERDNDHSRTRFQSYFEQDVFSANPEYELISPRTELRLGTNISTFRRLTTQMYPYVVSEKMICSQTYISSVFHLGKLDLKAAASFAIGNFTEKTGLRQQIRNRVIRLIG